MKWPRKIIHQWRKRKLIDSLSKEQSHKKIDLYIKAFWVADISPYHIAIGRGHICKTWTNHTGELVRLLHDYINLIMEDKIIPDKLISHLSLLNNNFDDWMTDEDDYELDIRWVHEQLQSALLRLNIAMGSYSHTSNKRGYYMRKLKPLLSDVEVYVKFILINL